VHRLALRLRLGIYRVRFARQGITIFDPTPRLAFHGVSGSITAGRLHDTGIASISDARRWQAIDDFIAENGPAGNPFTPRPQFVEGAARRASTAILVGHAKQNQARHAGVALNGSMNASARRLVATTSQCWYKFPSWSDSIDSTHD